MGGVSEATRQILRRGYLSGKPISQKAEATIRSDPQLIERQKNVIVDVFRDGRIDYLEVRALKDVGLTPRKILGLEFLKRHAKRLFEKMDKFKKMKPKPKDKYLLKLGASLAPFMFFNALENAGRHDRVKMALELLYDNSDGKRRKRYMNSLTRFAPEWRCTRVEKRLSISSPAAFMKFDYSNDTRSCAILDVASNRRPWRLIVDLPLGYKITTRIGSEAELYRVENYGIVKKRDSEGKKVEVVQWRGEYWNPDMEMSTVVYVDIGREFAEDRREEIEARFITHAIMR